MPVCAGPCDPRAHRCGAAVLLRRSRERPRPDPDMLPIQTYDDLIAAETFMHIRLGPHDVLCLKSPIRVAKRAVRVQNVIDAADWLQRESAYLRKVARLFDTAGVSP